MPVTSHQSPVTAMRQDAPRQVGVAGPGRARAACGVPDSDSPDHPFGRSRPHRAGPGRVRDRRIGGAGALYCVCVAVRSGLHDPAGGYHRRGGHRPAGRPAGGCGGAIRRHAGGSVAAMTVPISAYLALSALLFVLGITGVLLRRNALVAFMSIELMLNAVNLTFVAFARQLLAIEGQLAVFFVILVAAVEVVVGLAIIMAIFRARDTVDIDDVDLLRG